ncbi:hypothetical protein TRVL_02075 [Trypanosoma vivax]|nr:hypothetical protein TRVL_02075 [Trypanosoma vivax]
MTDNLEEENKALRTKVSILEGELLRRNAECAKLRDEMERLERIAKLYDAQCGTVSSLQSALESSRAAHASALETIERMKRRERDEVYSRLVTGVRSRLAEAGEVSGVVPSGVPTAMTLASLPRNMEAGTRAPAGGVVKTSSGAQVVCNSSPISSIGFGPANRPLNLLSVMHGTPSHCAVVGNVVDEENEVAHLMEMVKEEAMMNIMYPEVADAEERQLRERLEALKQPKMS